MKNIKQEIFIGMEKKNTMFFGLGNQYMADDAAGVILVRKLKERNFKVIESGNDLMKSIHIFSCEDLTDIRKLVFIDAAKLNLKPGEVRIIDEHEVNDKCISTHENNFRLALHYIHSIIKEIDVLFIGIQFKDIELYEFPKLSREVENTVNNMVELISSSIK